MIKYMQHAYGTASTSQKNLKKSNKIVIQICPFSTKLQIPQEFTYTTLPQKLREAEICKMLKKLHRKQATDQRAQNATPAEETPCNHSRRDPPNATHALKM